MYFGGKIIEKMNSKQLCYSLLYHMCLFVGNKKNRESLRSGQEWLPAT